MEFIKPDLVGKSNWVIDIGEASNTLSDVLSKYNYKNLNDIFPDDNTTTEFMCREIHKELSVRLIKKLFKGRLKVKLFESHKAWASYDKLVE